MPTLIPISLTFFVHDTLWKNDIHLSKTNLTEVMGFTLPIRDINTHQLFSNWLDLCSTWAKTENQRCYNPTILCHHLANANKVLQKFTTSLSLLLIKPKDVLSCNKTLSNSYMSNNNSVSTLMTVTWFKRNRYIY